MRMTAMEGIAAVALIGCTAEDGREERVDEVNEPLAFSVTTRSKIGPDKVHVSQGGWIEVSIDGLHLQPPGCSKVSAGKVIPIRRGPPRVELPAREVKPDGKHKFETWNTLAAGDYELYLDPVGEFPLCHWEGDVFIAAK